MIDELLLHIGPPRTGTTTIQVALPQAAPESIAKGTFIPLAEGAEPGQHLPVLREVVGEAVMKERYSFSHDTLSLENVLREAADAGCSRLLFSAEEFATATEDVLALIRAVGPRRVIVLQSIRPVVPWMLSLFAQYITYGLNQMATWPLARFAEFFAQVILPAPTAAAECWRDGSWGLRTRTLFLGSSVDVGLAGKFSRLADLPVPLLPSRPENKRLDLCRLHLLQALNLVGFDESIRLSSRAAARESVLAALRATEMPPHECRCAERLAPAIQEYVAGVASGLLPAWLGASERTLGTPSAIERSHGGESMHAAYPGSTSSDLVSLVLIGELGRSIEAEASLRGRPMAGRSNVAARCYEG